MQKDIETLTIGCYFCYTKDVVSRAFNCKISYFNLLQLDSCIQQIFIEAIAAVTFKKFYSVAK